MTQASTASPKVKFATQMSEDVLTLLRETAKQEGRQIQSILDGALREYFEARQQNKARRHVVSALQASMAEFDSLYDELSK